MIGGSAAASCTICGAGRCCCGPETSDITPVDISDREREGAAVADKLQVYDVIHNGVPTRMKLNEFDAKRYGVWRDPVAPKAATKKRTAKNKAAAPEGA